MSSNSVARSAPGQGVDSSRNRLHRGFRHPGANPELKAAGLSIILAEQNLDFVLALSDRGYVLEKGAVVFGGTSAELMDNTEVQDRYLHV